MITLTCCTDLQLRKTIELLKRPDSSTSSHPPMDGDDEDGSEDDQLVGVQVSRK